MAETGYALSCEEQTPAQLIANAEQAAGAITVDDVAEAIVCGPDPEKHLDGIRKYAGAGYTHVYVHQVCPDQEGFFRFYEEEVLPKL